MASQLQEFWNKQPTCFRQACDDPSRILFRASTRSNWIFDLQLLDGDIRIYPQSKIDSKEAIGLKKLPFVTDLDFISKDLVSVLTNAEEGKWRRIQDLEFEKHERELKETLLSELPTVVKFPIEDEDFPLLFSVSKQAIYVVNTQEKWIDKNKKEHMIGKEYAIVNQRAQSEHDCIEKVFLTYKL